MKSDSLDKYLGPLHPVDKSDFYLTTLYGVGIRDELSAIREAYVLHPIRAAELAGVSLSTWHRWVRAGGVDVPGGMARETFIAWVRAIEADWLERNPQAPVTGSRWRIDSQGRTRRRALPTTNT